MWGDESQLVQITPRVGGISLHHCLALHGSPPNLSGRPRRGLVFQYRADDAYQLADTVFADTGLVVSGQRRGRVRCEARLGYCICLVDPTSKIPLAAPGISWATKLNSERLELRVYG